MKNDYLEMLERNSAYYLNFVIKYMAIVRIFVMRLLLPAREYFKTKSVYPISFKYGFDRGTPIDRYYIENFLENNKKYIRGKCLEIVDSTYIRKFGGKNVTHADSLDIFPTKVANIHGDLRNLHGVIHSNTYDCLIITQTFNVIDNFDAAIKESHRILKPGGVLLATLPALSPAWNLKINMWRYTIKSCQYIFSQHFKKKNVAVSSFGNPVSSQAFWLGLAQEDLSSKELIFNDRKLSCIIGIRAIK